VSFAPKWARPAAVLGLGLQLANAKFLVGLLDETEYRKRLDELTKDLAALPRD
jgi:hypothetical protein